MSYASVQDLIDIMPRGETELRELTADADAANYDTARAQRALDAATRLIDGYVGARYSLPLNPSPLLLTDLCADIARHELYADHPPDEVRKRFEDAERQLVRISRGELSLGVADGSTPPTRNGARSGQVRSRYDWEAHSGLA